MGSFFNIDNGFFAFLGKLCDMIVISIVFVLLCIPIVTIGPANTALYYVIVKVIRRERGYLFREFFKAFRLNFKKGAIIGVALTIMFVIIAFDILWAYTMTGAGFGWETILFGVFIALAFIVFSFSIYVFPILSRFEMTMKQLCKSAVFLPIRHLPSTIVMGFLTISSFVLVRYIPLLVFLLPAVVPFINSILMERILKKYIPVPVEGEDETRKDEWYLE